MRTTHRITTQACCWPCQCWRSRKNPAREVVACIANTATKRARMMDEWRTVQMRHLIMTHLSSVRTRTDYVRTMCTPELSFRLRRNSNSPHIRNRSKPLAQSGEIRQGAGRLGASPKKCKIHAKAAERAAASRPTERGTNNNTTSS